VPKLYTVDYLSAHYNSLIEEIQPRDFWTPQGYEDITKEEAIEQSSYALSFYKAAMNETVEEFLQAEAKPAREEAPGDLDQEI
jgi:hypothetical protein